MRKAVLGILLAIAAVVALAQPAKVPAGLSSPRATLSTFLAAANAGRWVDARRTMNLESISFAVRDTQGDRYAQMLVGLIDRIPDFDLRSLPTQPSSLIFDLPLVDARGRQTAFLELEKQPDGSWLFGRNTVAQIPDLYDRMRSLPKFSNFGSEDNALGGNSLRERIPDALRHSLLFMEIWQWVALAVLLVAGLLVSAIVRVITASIGRTVLKRLTDRIELGSQRTVRRSLGVLFATALWWVAFQQLSLPTWAFATTALLLKLFWAIGAIGLLNGVFDSVLDLSGSRASELLHRADHILIPVARKFGKFIILVAVALVLAASLDVNVAGLVAGLGIGGLVVALAAKDSVENIFGSLTILFDMPFGIGDWVKIGDTQGAVEEINLRSTRIRTGPDTIITLPNSNLIKASVENFSVRRFRQFSFRITVPYMNGTRKLDEYVRAVRKVILGHAKVRPDKTYVQIDSLTETSVTILVQGYLVTSDYAEELQLRETLLSKVIEEADHLKITLGSVPWMPVNAPEDLTPHANR